VKISKATTSNQLIGQVLHFFLDLKILFSFMLSKSESDKLQLGFCIGMVNGEIIGVVSLTVADGYYLG
jgi:hypothetical protein